MDKIKLEIIGMSYSQSQSGAYALILGETNGERRLPIIIGGFEAQAIAIELEKMKPSRPLTHDLFKSFADTFNITIKEVVINKLRFHCTIYTYEKIMSAAGIIVDDKKEKAARKKSAPKETVKNDYGQYPIAELKELLQKAVDKEDYEKASKIRDEINRRKEKK
jgi:bifunctional DNase/RNase